MNERQTSYLAFQEGQLRLAGWLMAPRRPALTEEVLREYIYSVAWRTAKTGDHQYTVVEWRRDLDPAFYAFVQYIRDNGYKQTFKGSKYTYFDLDGFFYWTMGAPVKATILINRRWLSTK